MNAYQSEDTKRQQPGYLEKYGLREAPFSILHKDKFLFLDAERSQCLDLLRHMTDNSNLLLLVEGERDAGKTSLLTRFVINAEMNWSICQITANTMMDADQLLFQIAQGFGLEQLPHDVTQLQELLYTHVAAMHRNVQVPILIVDDAHVLAKDALLAIFNLADACVEEQHLLRIILFCEPEIETILGADDVRQLRDRITHTMQVPALDEQATAEYLKHRMAVAGFDGASPFTPETVGQIYRASNGLPGIINQLAHQVLEGADITLAEPQQVPDEDEYKKPVRQYKIVVVAVVLLVAVIFFNMESGDEGTTPVINDTETSAVTGETPEPTQTDSAEKVQQKIIPLDAQAMAENAQQEDETPQTPDITHSDVAGQTAQQETNDQTAITNMQESGDAAAENNDVETNPAQPVSEAPQVMDIEPAKIVGQASPQTLSINGRGFTQNSEVVVSWRDREKKLDAQQVVVVNPNLIEITITTGEDADTWNLYVTDPQKGKSNTITFEVAAAELQPSDGKRWILSRPPAAFTLQLFGSNRKTSAQNFLTQHGIQQQATFFQSVRDGQDWFSVIYGEYSDQQAASDAIKSLPASLKGVKPWVRRFDDIHASINSSSKPTKPLKEKPAVPVSASVPTNASANEYAAWLWSQDPSKFTLQLLGARDVEGVQQFLRKYADLGGKAVYFHTHHDGKDWYTVVYGIYSDKAAAKRAIERLPAELKSSSPWIRSFASIHAELARAQ